MSHKKMSLFISGCLIVGAAVACGHKVDRDKNDKGDSAKTKTAADKTKAEQEGKGGQPGIPVIGLNAMDSDGKIVDGLHFNMLTGKGADGKQAPLTTQAKPVKSLSESDEKALKDVKALKTYINVGCSEDQLKDVSLSGLTKQDAPKVYEDGIYSVKANVVTLCGDLQPFLMASFTADTILVSDAKSTLRARSGSESVSFRANRLIIKGNSEIKVVELDATSTPVERVMVIVNDKVEVKNVGQLTLTTQGADAGSSTPPSKALLAQKEAAKKAAEEAAKKAAEETTKQAAPDAAQK